MSHSELPLELSQEYRRQLRALLPYVASHATVSNLVSAHRDAEGKLVYDSPVLNRPWEWIENLGDNPILDAKDEEKERQEKARLGMKYLIKNSASLSLETFGARIPGDGILHNIATEDDPRVEGNIRFFEDGLSAESVFERDWRQTRLELGTESSTSSGRTKGDDGDESDALPALTQIAKTPSTPRKPSPTCSAGSRITTTSIRHSPGLGSIKELAASPEGDAVEIESVTSNYQKSTKRKAESDEEPKAIEGPSHVPKKSNVKSQDKVRSKKRRDNCGYLIEL
jgi:mediator of RNA polymerase II transcription subunit 12